MPQTKPNPVAQPRTKKPSSWAKRIKTVLVLLIIILQIAFIAGSVYAAEKLTEASKIVPNISNVMREMTSQPSEILAADGSLLFRVQAKNRQAVRRIEVPNQVVNAILAAEDKRFYRHPGVDLWAVGRAIAFGGREGGGSTLTMQLAKRVYTSPVQSIERKLQDMALAIMMERLLTKDQVLELYLNEVFFGEGAYGIAAAADVYFGKELKDLTIAEAALLARVVRRPSDQNPVANPRRAVANRNVVLGIMREENMITESEYREALNEPLKLRSSRAERLASEKRHPFFVDYVLHELKEAGIDITSGGYRVVTTLDVKAQEIAEKGVRDGLRQFRRRGVNQMSFVCADSTGRVLAMVGGGNYERSQFNMIWMGQGRQPGSAFKQFVYASGIELGAFGPRSGISTKTVYWNVNGRQRAVRGGANVGSISISRALASSNNTAAVRAIQMVGPSNVSRMARDSFGFRRSNLPATQSLALGSGEVYPIEMLAGLSVFQSGGDRYTAYAIETVQAPDGSVRSMTPAMARGVIDRRTSEAIDAAMRAVVTGGTGRAAGIVKNARGKTGTTSDYKDAWFVGYTDKLIGVAWLAREEIVNGRAVAVSMRGVMGGEGAAPTWGRIMRDIQRHIGEEGRAISTNMPDGAEREEPVTDPAVDRPVEEEGSTPTETPTEAPVQEGPPVEDPPAEDPPAENPPANEPPVTPPATTGGGGARQEVVYVSVCADSGQRANGYCPETVRRPFVKGNEPRGSCSVHGPMAEAIQATWVAALRPAAPHQGCGCPADHDHGPDGRHHLAAQLNLRVTWRS